MPELHATIAAVTDNIRQRSAVCRDHYLQRIDAAIDNGPVRKTLSCTNQAHAFAAFPELDFLAYLGSWQENDEEWLAVSEWQGEKETAQAPPEEKNPLPLFRQSWLGPCCVT